MIRFLLLLLLPFSALAQSSLPNADHTQPGAPHYIVTKNGACMWFYSYTDKGHTQHVYCSSLADFPNIGGRVRTIVNAADPLRALQTAKNRILNFTPMTCVDLVCSTGNPALIAVVNDLNAVRK